MFTARLMQTVDFQFDLLKHDKLQHTTNVYVHWLADVHLAVFARAFPFVVSRQEIRPQTANT
jgi:hypothetical protein